MHSRRIGRGAVILQGNPRKRYPDMTNHISIQVESDEQYERLQQVREKYGVTWKGLLIQGTFHLEAQDTAVEEDEP
jgi:hypothetical protein